ncbi:MAG: hypothetical protein V2I97_07415 [Desulfococcaceae bacterium]|jgi:hypothetical protein|nr:hypothetical protein [Desulfococcaceae bacterium]
MSENMESKSVEQLMAEADELMRQINFDVISEMEEENRLQFEKHVQNLEKIKSGVQGRTEKKETPETDSGAAGMHEAILDIVKAMRTFAG